MCRGTALGTGREPLLSERQEANCRDRRLLQYSRLAGKLGDLAMDQPFVGQGAACFIWSAVPYREEWRYGTQAAKGILLDAGHVCQDLYLACESIGCGACAIAAYRQEELDRFLGLDGEDELVVYLAPVGKVEGA